MDRYSISKLPIILTELDSYWRYKLTIVTKIHYTNNKKKNIGLLKQYSFDEFIKEIKKKIRKKLKNIKYQSLYLKDFDKYFLSITSFETTQKDSGELIHFHYLFSNFIQSNSNLDNQPIIDQLEKEIFISFKKHLKYEEKLKNIQSYHFEPYIPYDEFIKDYPFKRTFSNYIIKEISNIKFPYPFYSKALKKKLKDYENNK